MKYLRVNPEQVSENSISYITIKEENPDVTRLPVDWTLEFFVNIEISIDNNKDFFIFDFYTNDYNISKTISIKFSTKKK